MADITQIKVGSTTYNIRDTSKAAIDHTHSQYLTSHQSLANYAKKTDIPSVPTSAAASTNTTSVNSLTAGGSGSLDFYSSSTTTTASGKTNDRIPFVTAQGTFTAGTTPPKSATLSSSNADTESTTVVTKLTPGSGDLTSDSTSTNGIAYVSSISKSWANSAASSTHTHPISVATLVGVLSEVFVAGTPPVASATLSTTYTTTTSPSSTTTVLTGTYSSETLTLSTASVASSTHSHYYYKPSSITLTRGSTPCFTSPSGIPSNKVFSTDSLSSGTVAIYSYSENLKYLQHTHTPTTGTTEGHTHTYTKATSVTLNVGTPPSLSSATINYLGHTHTAPSYSSISVAKGTHTHSLT